MLLNFPSYCYLLEIFLSSSAAVIYKKSGSRREDHGGIGPGDDSCLIAQLYAYISFKFPLLKVKIAWPFFGLSQSPCGGSAQVSVESIILPFSTVFNLEVRKANFPPTTSSVANL